MLNRLIEPRQQIPEERKRFSNAALKDLILPIIIEQFLVLLVGIADTLMVSHVREAAVSGISLVSQLNNVFIMVFTALASGGAVVVSQYIGSRDHEKGAQAASQLVMITGLISLLATGIVPLFGRQLFDLLFGRVETDVLQSGLTYLRISAYSFVFDEKHLPANMALKNRLMEIAADKKVTAAQLALAWLLAQKPFIVLIPGVSKPERVKENVWAAEIDLSAQERDEVNHILDQIPIVGERYDPNSENGQSVRK
ncbi:MAG: aldo/keto reductase [Oscillospiraceae bacterium]|nr:aldo/keto reductase [Oscillospiraceae bacterium]